MLDLTQKPRSPLVAASILSADFGDMARDCRAVLDLGADLLHIDVMDGHFVPNLTMGADMIRALRRHLPDVVLDVHLMVERPADYIDSFADAGTNLFSFHVEVCDSYLPGGLDGLALMRRIQERGMLAGIVINPPTPVAYLEPYVAHADNVLVMSVNPGRSGQAFMPEVLPKVRWARERAKPTARIEMDGGVSPATVEACVAAGADMLVTASALFGADDRAAVIRALKAPGLA